MLAENVVPIFVEEQKSAAQIIKTLATLPKGSVYAVKRGERRYYYHQIYTEKGRVQKYVRLSQVEELKKSIDIRRGLEEQLRKLKKEIKLLHSILKRLKIDAKQVYREGLQKVRDMHQKWAEKEKRRRESRRDAYGFDNKNIDYLKKP